MLLARAAAHPPAIYSSTREPGRASGARARRGGLPRAYLELAGFLGQLHAEPVPLRHLGVELLHLRVQLLPLVLGLGLDLLQHLDLARQLLVVRLQALLVLLQIRFELGGEGRKTCYF